MSSVEDAADRTFTLSLVSHTNVGKTTLARTLLQRDVGEVLDQAHVTDVSEAHTMIETDAGERMVLWDTPGFGDTVRLLRRLRGHANPFGWFLGQVWDRFADRPLWCNQQAVRNVQRDADVVLYLVSAAEDPETAGYVETEMSLLDWIGRPVVVLLTQTGPPRPREEESAEVEDWRAAVAHHESVREVMALDGFTRCWVQECLLLDKLRVAVSAEKRGVFARLSERWKEERLAVFHQALDEITELLEQTATDRVPVPNGAKQAEKVAVTQELAERLKGETRATMYKLIEMHGLEGASVHDFQTELEDFRLPEESVDPKRAGLIGGLVSGAITGLATDVMSGGLTLGGGMLAGGLLGALGAAGLARGFQQLRGERESEIAWSPEFLTKFAGENLLRYLAVAHFGRGRGEYREMERPGFWVASVSAAFARNEARLQSLWKRYAEGQTAQGKADLRAALQRLLTAALSDVFGEFYPDAVGVFGEDLARDPGRRARSGASG